LLLNKEKVAFYAVKRSTSVKLKEKDGCHLRQQTLFVSANEKAPSHGSGLTKCRTSSSRKFTSTLYCHLQVHYELIYK